MIVRGVRDHTERHPDEQPPELLATTERIAIVLLVLEEMPEQALNDVVLVFSHAEPWG